MNIENRIKQIRESKRIKQIEVAEALNMDNSQYAKIEKRGSKLSLEQIEAIANALKVSVAELIGIDVSNTVDNSDEMGKLLKENEELKERLNKFERIFGNYVNVFVSSAFVMGMQGEVKELLNKREEIEKHIDFDNDDIADIDSKIYEELKSMIVLELKIKKEDNNISDKWIENSILNFLATNEGFLSVTIGDEYKLAFNKQYHNFLYEFEKERKNKTLKI